VEKRPIPENMEKEHINGLMDQDMKDKHRMTSSMVKERRPKPTEMFMKGCGRMTEVTACVRLFLLMEMFTLERWPIPKDMDMENLPMPMELVGMMVNGRMISPKRTTLQAPKRIYLDCLGKKNKNPCLSLSKIASF
jgi:hypothetical protein